MEKVSFAAIGDLHVGGIDREDAETMVEVVNDLPVDFAIFLGDMVNKPTQESVDEFAGYARKIKHPYYLVTGNHDSADEEQGFDIETKLSEALPGIWSESFTYSFQMKGWNFITCGMTTGTIPYKGVQINQYKGHMSEKGGVCRIPEHHLLRFKELVEASGDRPTVVALHVPLTRMAKRLMDRRCFCQVRLLEQFQMLSIIESKPNVKMAIYGHDHFNQVDVMNDVLHCISQSVKGYPPYKDPHAIRIVELSDSGIKSRLVWKDWEVRETGAIGTLQGDMAFEWKF